MKKREAVILSLFILAKFLLQAILIHPVYELQRDEYLHLDQANHLAWGYESVPPFTSWTSWIIKLFGNGEFWVKFFPAFFGALTIVVVWKTIDFLKGNLYAKILGASCILLSVLLRLNTLYQPNSFDVLSWTTTFYFLIKYIDTNRPKWLYYTALIFAFGFLNKYNILFLVMGLLPAILVTKARGILLRKEVYLAGLLALIIVLPNLIWQYNNDFPVIHHLNELAERQLVNVERSNFLKNQVLFFLGGILVILAGLWALILYKPFENLRFLFFGMLFTLVVFTYFRAKDYYAIGLYPIYIAIGAVYVSNLFKNKIGQILKPLFLLIPLLVFALSYNIAYPNKTPEYIIPHQETYKDLGMLRWEDGKDHNIPQDYADMLGWRELAMKVDSAMEHLKNPKATLIQCDNYGQAGAINYYSEKGLQAVTFEADYQHWFNLDQQYTNLIRVVNSNERDQELTKIRPYFEKTTVYDSITNPYARETGTIIFIFENSKVDINNIIATELKDLKNR